MKFIVLYMIRIYQRFISPITPASCRFQPTCSQYGVEAIRYYGVIKGGLMTAWRICKCHPFHKGGFDPVPLKEDNQHK